MPTDQPSHGAGHRELYLLVVGVLVGVLLGPGVLGRFNPEAYDRWFVGSGAIDAKIEAAKAKNAEDLKNMVQSGVTRSAIEELNAKRSDEMMKLNLERQVEQYKTSRALSGRANALLLAVLAMMVIETLMGPSAASLRARVTIARYSLTAAWIAIVLAQPTMIMDTPIGFASILVIVAVAGATIPMPALRKPKTS